jgi:hypothetical protein
LRSNHLDTTGADRGPDHRHSNSVETRSFGVRRVYRVSMTNGSPDRITVELTADEARLIVAALRRFEPFWPSDLDDLSRAELLAGIRQGIEHVVDALDAPRTSAS